MAHRPPTPRVNDDLPSLDEARLEDVRGGAAAAGAAPMASAATNPLYEAQTSGGVNPLFE